MDVITLLYTFALHFPLWSMSQRSSWEYPWLEGHTADHLFSSILEEILHLFPSAPPSVALFLYVTKPNPFEIIPLQTTRKENNWKNEEALARATVTLETEQIKVSNPWCLWWYFFRLFFQVSIAKLLSVDIQELTSVFSCNLIQSRLLRLPSEVVIIIVHCSNTVKSCLKRERSLHHTPFRQFTDSFSQAVLKLF